jgi:hypothetical protein
MTRSSQMIESLPNPERFTYPRPYEPDQALLVPHQATLAAL